MFPIESLTQSFVSDDCGHHNRMCLSVTSCIMHSGCYSLFVLLVLSSEFSTRNTVVRQPWGNYKLKFNILLSLTVLCASDRLFMHTSCHILNDIFTTAMLQLCLKHLKKIRNVQGRCSKWAIYCHTGIHWRLTAGSLNLCHYLNQLSGSFLSFTGYFPPIPKLNRFFKFGVQLLPLFTHHWDAFNMLSLIYCDPTITLVIVTLCECTLKWIKLSRVTWNVTFYLSPYIH